MDIFSIFTLCGGLAFFLYGISAMSAGLEKIAGGKLEQILKKITSNPLKSFAVGTIITALIQSSSAVTVMLVGLVNSGIMNLSQTVGVIIGANVGTTMTAWILSLTGLEASNIFLRLLKPESFTPILALIGVIMIMAAKTNKRKNIGTVLIGFSILMFGMQVMSGAMAPLSDMPEFRNIMVAFTNPFLGLLVGIIVTMILQSSSASVGILQALSMVGGISYGAAIPIICGQNIGTCVSAVLSAIGTNTNAQRVAVIHIVYNCIGAIMFLILFFGVNAIFNFAFTNQDINPFGIAVVHTIFNVTAAFILLPCGKLLEIIAVKTIKGKNKSEETVILDDRLLLAPSFAISEAYKQSIKMAEMVEDNYNSSTKMLKSYHKKKAESMKEKEIEIDLYEDKLNSYLLKLSGKGLSEEDNSRISQLLLAIGDFERIGDHANRILEITEKMRDNNTKLSDKGLEELQVIANAVSEIYTMSLKAYRNDDVNAAHEVEPLEAVIKKLVRKVKKAHIQRLQDGECTPALSFMFSDLLTDYRRIAAHCGNIAISVIQLKETRIGKHQYNHRNMDEEEETIFKSKYQDYKSKFSVTKEKPEI